MQTLSSPTPFLCTLVAIAFGLAYLNHKRKGLFDKGGRDIWTGPSLKVVNEDSITVTIGQITLPSVSVQLTVGCRPVHDPSQWKVAIMECVTFDLVSKNVLVQFRDGSEQTATPTWREQRVLRGRAWADKRSTKQHVTLLLDFIGKHVVRRLNLPVTSQDWSQQAGRRAQATALAALHRKKMQQAHTKQEKKGLSMSGQATSTASTTAEPASNEDDVAESSNGHMHDTNEAGEEIEPAEGGELPHTATPRQYVSAPRDSDVRSTQNRDSDVQNTENFADVEKEEWQRGAEMEEWSKEGGGTKEEWTTVEAPAPANEAKDKSLEEAFEEMCAVSEGDNIKAAQAS